jgi:glycosyltransferase involved in cell wall biosynthesis
MKIAISWNELPKYAAYPIAEIIKKNPEVEIISIKSKLPIYNLEKILKKKIHWVKNKNLKWKHLNLEIPDIYFQAGWYKKSFSSLGLEVKNNGGKVVLLSDNPYKNNFRQLIGSIIFKFKYKNYFDAVWVPGKLGEELMKYYGLLKKKIFQGLYCSNKNIFKKGIKISKRPKTFLFVGNLIKEKGFTELLISFKFFLKTNKDWKLIIVGNGLLRKTIPKHPNIEYFSFKKPEEIAKLMQQSRFLVLPSYSDHWPLVINEATLCGCGLIVSNVIGNIPELSNNRNSIICKIASEKSLTAAIEKASMLSDAKFDKMFNESLKLSSKFTISNWVKNYQDIINSLKN